jgi:hypothetical protein
VLAALPTNAYTVTDVSADADPNTGAAVYDSVRSQGFSGCFRFAARASRRRLFRQFPADAACILLP